MDEGRERGDIKPWEWKPGQSGNLKGRPRKWVCTLRKHGYKKCEIVDCINVLIAMSENELLAISKRMDITVLEKVVSLAILESIKRKSLYNLETLLTRVYGQPKQEVEQNLNITKFDVKFNDGDNIPKE